MIPVLDRTGSLPLRPRRSRLTRWFWEGLDEGRLATTRCAACGRLSFPPRPDCPDCWHAETAWQDLSGIGTLYSRTRIAVVPEKFIDRSPIDLGIVDLDEGVRITCWLIDGAESLALDRRVQLVALRFADGCLLAARPAP